MKNRTIANAVSLSWDNPKTREARLKRHAVLMQVNNGDLIAYESVPKACQAIGVKQARSIRLAVVAAGERGVPLAIIVDGMPVVFLHVERQ